MKALVPLLALCAGLASVHAVSPPAGLVSPEAHPDRHATFRIFAPGARAVSLVGDWMPPGTPLPMACDASGVWSVRTGPLETGPNIYTFRVDDLTLADPVNPAVKLRARTSASLVTVPDDPADPWAVRDVPHGTVEVIWAASRVCGDTRAYRVYTPPGYPRGAGRGLPVLYLLHGNNDTAAGWTDVGRANFILDNLIAEGHAVPMVVVMPWGHAAPFSAPGPENTALMERYLLDEVIPQVESRYRVSRRRERRAVAGLSMGGGHALHVGLGNTDRFGAVAAFSSAAPPAFEERFAHLWTDPERTNDRLSLLWIGCGRADAAFGRSEDLERLLTRHGIHHTFFAMEGLHNYAVWRRCLAEVAPLLFR